jgi:hypothetical protein
VSRLFDALRRRDRVALTSKPAYGIDTVTAVVGPVPDVQRSRTNLVAWVLLAALAASAGIYGLNRLISWMMP